ncbi:MAG: MarR family winged helix-turn-helix transcriptional regulator [Tumebacillaceae bacterium]
MDINSLELLEYELAILVRRITSMANEKKFGNLDRSAYLLLHKITAHSSAGVKMLAEELKLDISTVSRQLAALEQKGYVHRTPDPTDGRALLFQITELGRQEFTHAKQERIARVEERLSSWPEEDRVLFAELLKKFNDGAK